MAQERLFDVERKNRIKKIRAVVQLLILLVIAYFVVTLVIFPVKYKPYQPTGASALTGGAGEGFVALGFFDITDMNATPGSLNRTERIQEHLEALKASGFSTVTQQDIIGFYTSGRSLPEKALFLMFEDGRRETTTLAHSLLERLNYIATTFTYAQDLDQPGTVYLNNEDVKRLLGTSFWEVGTHGYRISYINVFDRYGNYMGEMDNKEFSRVRTFLDRNYNHFLMDYIRDADDIPKETTRQMAQRMQEEYRLMRDQYTLLIGEVPHAYALMHANSGKFGTHDHASEQNERLISETFGLNFNREGFCFNNHAASVYDLTRMQPQAYWYTNHLLMRIQSETGMPMAFVRGNKEFASKFVILEGEAEFKDNIIALTSTAQGKGVMRLERDLPADLDIEVQLHGNPAGTQTLHLRSDADGSNSIGVVLEDNRLYVRQVVEGVESELFKYDLRVLDKKPVLSVEEHEHLGLKTYYEAIIELDTNPQKVAEAQKSLLALMRKIPRTIAQGAEPYIPKIDVRQQGIRTLRITLRGSLLDVSVDDKPAAVGVAVPSASGRYMVLSCRPLLPDANQRNVYDPVYDGVFVGLTVRDSLAASKPVMFEQNLPPVEAFFKNVKNGVESVVEWFIQNL